MSIFGTEPQPVGSRQCPWITSPVRFEGSILAVITREYPETSTSTGIRPDWP
ncbi:hypothetical protein ACWF95_41185 [Streptomyces vinaceus]